MTAQSKAAEIALKAERDQTARNRWLTSPSLVIVVIFGIFPLLIICIYSFLKAAPYGGVIWQFSTDAYLNFLFQKDIFDDTLQFTPDFLIIYLRTTIYAIATTVICLILFLGGVQLLCLGIIGSYLAHIYDEVKRRPPFIVESILNRPSATRNENGGAREQGKSSIESEQ